MATYAEERLKALRKQYNFEKRTWPDLKPTLPQGTRLVNGVLQWVPGQEPKIHSVTYEMARMNRAKTDDLRPHHYLKSSEVEKLAPTVGRRATCANCGAPIEFGRTAAGLNWFHVKESDRGLCGKATPKRRFVTDRSRMRRVLDTALDMVAADEHPVEMAKAHCRYCGMPVTPGKTCGRTQCIERAKREAAGSRGIAMDRVRMRRALDAAAKGDVRVIWTDRAYAKHEKAFKNDPQGAPENALVKARAFAARLDKDQDIRAVRIVME